MCVLIHMKAQSAQLTVMVEVRTWDNNGRLKETSDVNKVYCFSLEADYD